jgi:hypothetical protein
MQSPDPLLVNPESQTIGIIVSTQFPFPSLLYPLGQSGWGIGVGVIPIQSPFASRL